MHRFMFLTLAVLLASFALTSPVFATQPIAQQVGTTNCMECHRSRDGAMDNPPNLDPDKRDKWEKFISENTRRFQDDNEDVGSPTDGPRAADTTDLLNDGMPDFDGLEDLQIDRDEPRNNDPDDRDDEFGPRAATSNSGETELMDDELIRIDLELRELEADIRTYRGLLETAKDASEAESLKRTIFAYDAQRRALIEQRSQLRGIREKTRAGSDRDDELDPDFTSRVFERAQGRRLKPEDGVNPLSPESWIGQAVEDVFTAQRVTEDNEVQKFIERIKDPALKEKVNSLYQATRLDPSMKDAFQELLAAIEKAGDDASLDEEDIASALEKVEAEAKRRNLDSGQLVELYLGNAGTDKISGEAYTRLVDEVKRLAEENTGDKALISSLSSALTSSTADYAAYLTAERGFLADQGSAQKSEMAERAFQKHLASLKEFFKLVDDVISRAGGDRDAIYAKNAPAESPVEAPVLETNRPESELVVPDAPTSVSPTTVSEEEPPTPQEEPEPTEAEKAQPEAMAKLKEKLESLERVFDTKLKEVDHKMVTAWTTDESFYAGWFSDNARQAALRDLSKVTFSWTSSQSAMNTFLAWPDILEKTYAQARERGIDLDNEPSLAELVEKARRSVLGTMLITRKLKGYNGHLKQVEGTSIFAATKALYIDRGKNPPEITLEQFRESVNTDSTRVLRNIDDLWSSQSLRADRTLLDDRLNSKARDNLDSDLKDLELRWHWYLQRMNKGYSTSSTPGSTYAIWMSVRDTTVYQLTELVNHYLAKKKYFEAGLVMGEIK